MEDYYSEAIVEKSSLESQIQDLKAEITHYEEVMKAKDDTSSTKMAEIEAKTNALAHKDASISALHEELVKVREYLAAKKQVRTTKLLCAGTRASYMHVRQLFYISCDVW